MGHSHLWIISKKTSRHKHAHTHTYTHTHSSCKYLTAHTNSRKWNGAQTLVSHICLMWNDLWVTWELRWVRESLHITLNCVRESLYITLNWVWDDLCVTIYNSRHMRWVRESLYITLNWLVSHMRWVRESLYVTLNCVRESLYITLNWVEAHETTCVSPYITLGTWDEFVSHYTWLSTESWVTWALVVWASRRFVGFDRYTSG